MSLRQKYSLYQNKTDKNKPVFLLLELRLTDKCNLILIFKTEWMLFACNGAHELHQRMGKAQGVVASDIIPLRDIAYKDYGLYFALLSNSALYV